MSEKNREGKRTARERLAVEREKHKRAEKRRRALIVGTAVAGVLALAAVIGVIAASAGKDEGSGEASGPAVAPSGAQGKDALAIPVGKESAKSTLIVWEDFRCPACKGFEQAYRSTIHELTEAGQLKVEYHLATIIDGNMGGSGSRTAANAAACAQDAGKFTAYHDVLYDHQPAETDDAFADNDKLIELAGKVKGLTTPRFRRCVTEGTHGTWVEKSNAAFQKGDFQGTPTVLLDGKSIYGDRSMTPAKLEQMVREANA